MPAPGLPRLFQRSFPLALSTLFSSDFRLRREETFSASVELLLEDVPLYQVWPPSLPNVGGRGHPSSPEMTA